MDFIQLQTDRGAAFLFNIETIGMIDAKNCQIYTADNPVYGWTLSQKSMDDLMRAVGPHIVAADHPEPAAKVVKEWNPNDKAEPEAKPVLTPERRDELEDYLREREERRKFINQAIKDLEAILWPTT